MRIDIIGLPGSGKSTLALAIAKKLSIAHIELDRFWFESGGRQGRHDTPNLESVRKEVRQRTAEAINAESWVSDGTYLHVQDLIADRADTIIFLDIPLSIRLLGHARRIFSRNKRHQELSLRDEVMFFAEIIKRDFSSRPKLLKFVDEHNDKVVRLKSHKEADDFLSSL